MIVYLILKYFQKFFNNNVSLKIASFNTRFKFCELHGGSPMTENTQRFKPECTMLKTTLILNNNHLKTGQKLPVFRSKVYSSKINQMWGSCQGIFKAGGGDTLCKYGQQNNVHSLE